MNTGIARMVAAAALAVGISYVTLVPAQAQESVVKQCGDKWAAAKTAGTTAGATWPKFLSQCRADMAASAPVVIPAAAPAVTTASAPVAAQAPVAAAAAPAVKTTGKARAAAVPAATGSAVFPSAIAPQFASETAGKARRDTCLAQYHANKATNGNGGLSWIVKGGGYYSECNKQLKG